MALRPYQLTLKNDVYQAWNQGAKNVLMRLDTGGGKTVILSEIATEVPGPWAIIAHRHELVGQLSIALARNGVHHDLIASETTIRAIVADHVALFGRSFYRPGAPARVASVDTLVKRKDLGPWASQVRGWITDEGHHVVDGNKWHTALQMFTHQDCRGLLPTATPGRADGMGLGRHADGVADVMVQGPPMRWLIEQGFLTDYRIICATTDMQLLEEQASASGDWSTATLRKAARESSIVGDVVKSYLRWGAGRLGVTFAPDTETAAEITQAYQAAGVAAGLVTGKTDPTFRRQIIRNFSERRINQLVVVDIVSEGFDLPAIEVASFARKTLSLATYMQQFGRALRILEGKDRATIIDHVGNFLFHGPPDRERPWTLDARAGRSERPDDEIPLSVCLHCYAPYERFYRSCPHCGLSPPPPVGRSAPAMVDGDLMELDAETLAALRGAVVEANLSVDEYRHKIAATGLHTIGVMTNVKRHAEKLELRDRLRDAMERRGGVLKARGLTDAEMQREFYLRFGVTVLEAFTLNRADTEKLLTKVDGAVNLT